MLELEEHEDDNYDYLVRIDDKPFKISIGKYFFLSKQRSLLMELAQLMLEKKDEPYTSTKISKFISNAKPEYELNPEYFLCLYSSEYNFETANRLKQEFPWISPIRYIKWISEEETRKRIAEMSTDNLFKGKGFLGNKHETKNKF